MQHGVQAGHAVAAPGDAHSTIPTGVGHAFAYRVAVAGTDQLIGPLAHRFDAGAFSGGDGRQVVIDHVLLQACQHRLVHMTHLLGQSTGGGLVHVPVQHCRQDGRVAEMQIRGEREHRLDLERGHREHPHQMTGRHHPRIHRRAPRTVRIGHTIRVRQTLDHHLMRSRQPLPVRTIAGTPPRIRGLGGTRDRLGST